MEEKQEWSNLQIAHLFRSVAAAYSLKKGDNRFKVIAYQRAADAVEHATSELHDLWQEEKLGSIPGIGASITAHLEELFRRGRSKHFDELLGAYPEAVFELMNVPGVGAKTAYKLAKTLGISRAHNALERLEEAARKGHIRIIEGFGADSEEKILKSIAEIKSRTRRLLLPLAISIAEDVVTWLKRNPAVLTAEPLGSLRRWTATVGDIDVAVATVRPEEVVEHFKAYPKTSRVIEAGAASASLMLGSEIQVDLYLQPPESFGSLLQHLTGSKHHNIALRTYAQKQGFSLSEYGIIKTKQPFMAKEGKIETGVKHNHAGLHQFSSETDFYHFLKMDWIPPELREDTGEIQAALENKLPNLVNVGQIKGDLQIHSDFPIEPSHDVGDSSPEEIVKTADAIGYEYVALTEHNPSVSNHSAEQIINLIQRKKETIEEINCTMNNYTHMKKVFNSLEIDIQTDGGLSVPEKALELLDFALVSIHSSFSLPAKEMTDRVLKALAHAKVKVFAHPTARLLNQRESIDLEWERIFDFCLKNQKWLEIDAEPTRLDLPDVLVREAVKYGVKMTLGTDSHAQSSLTMMRYGVAVARRGWAEPKDIVNTLNLEQLKRLLP